MHKKASNCVPFVSRDLDLLFDLTVDRQFRLFITGRLAARRINVLGMFRPPFLFLSLSPKKKTKTPDRRLRYLNIALCLQNNLIFFCAFKREEASEERESCATSWALKKLRLSANHCLCRSDAQNMNAAIQLATWYHVIMQPEWNACQQVTHNCLCVLRDQKRKVTRSKASFELFARCSVNFVFFWYGIIQRNF